MGATYEVWLTDDSGNKMFLLDKYSSIYYTRCVNILSTIQIMFPFKEWFAQVKPYFQPDWRIDVWRSPATGVPMRREDMYMLRKAEIYTRKSDGVQMIVLRGRNGMELLNRRSVVQYEETSYTEKTDYIDDMMKAIVREQCLYGSCVDADGVSDNDRAFPVDEFVVQEDLSLGPSTTMVCVDKVVFDVIKELREASFDMNYTLSTNRKIYYGVVPFIMTDGRVGYRFETYADLRGADRTNGVVFSVENGNMLEPNYEESHFDEINVCYAKGQGLSNERLTYELENLTLIQKSRWNRREEVRSATNESTEEGLITVANTALAEGRPSYMLDATFLNTPGSENTPRSLYGLDWDMGDLVPVNYAGKQFDIEIYSVGVTLDEGGAESIIGRSVENGE